MNKIIWPPEKIREDALRPLPESVSSYPIWRPYWWDTWDMDWLSDTHCDIELEDPTDLI
jgi:hypothetical protein